MSRRLLVARGEPELVPPDPLPEEPDPWEPPPYYAGTVPAMPTSAPWHRSEPCDIPTYDGYDQTLHPTVVDFGGQWNGYRWWMMHTPYPVGIGGVIPDYNENPSLAASNDCVTWTPIGDQPLIPQPPDNGYNSDNEMAWNPDAARMELWWRPVANLGEQLLHMHSPDALTWTSPTTHFASYGNFVSPSIIRFAANDWRMWMPDAHSGPGGIPPTYRLYRSQATSPEGPWSTPVVTASNGLDASQECWHAGVAHDTNTGTLYALAHMYIDDQIYGGTSTDGGITWEWGNTPILTKQAGFTESSLYRPCLVIHENGTHARVWYSGRSTTLGWRVGYAEVPLSLWPDA